MRLVNLVFCLTLLLTLLLLLPQNLKAADVTLAWDANTEEDLAGYKLYYGEASRRYGAGIDVGNNTQGTILGLIDGQTYYFAVTAYNTEEAESKFSKELVHTIEAGDPDPEPLPIPACCADIFKEKIADKLDIIIKAENAIIIAPMQIGEGQYVFTNIPNSGSVAFIFDIIDAGQYIVRARIHSQNSSSRDSFRVGMDGETIETNYHVYDTIIVSAFTWDIVSLRGPTGTFDRADLDPMVWTLSPGSHSLIFYGRESNTWLDKINIKKYIPVQ